jgi:hypothetical protein
MSIAACSVPDCNGKHLAKGYCSKHYQRKRFTGKVELTPSRSSDERFMSFVKVDPDTCAWLWQGGISSTTGYGVFYLNGKSVSAHRYSYQMAHGAIPDDVFVCHKYEALGRHNVNPEHLFLGTATDNMQDAAAKRRTLIGERNLASKLSATEAAEIASSKDTCSALSERYGVSECVVSKIRRGLLWGSVTKVSEAGRLRLDNKSGYIGVRWRERGQKWNASIGRRINGTYKSEYLGCFDNVIDAAKAYDMAAKRYFGDGAKLNFP